MCRLQYVDKLIDDKFLLLCVSMLIVDMLIDVLSSVYRICKVSFYSLFDIPRTA